MQQLVRRYTFATNGQVRELDVMRQGNGEHVGWSVFVDNALAVSKDMKQGTSEFSMAFKVPVSGMRVPLDACILMESMTGSWQYVMMVHQAPVQPWWTLEEGDRFEDHPREVVDVEPFAPTWDGPSALHPLSDDVFSPDRNLPQLKSFRNQESRGFFVCCSGSSAAPESAGCNLGSSAVPDATVSRPRSVGKKSVELPNQDKINAPPPNFTNRPIAKTCNDASLQCHVWAQEVFRD